MASDFPLDPTERDLPQSTSAPDTTPKPRNEAAAQLPLRASDILENVSDAFVALDQDWRILYANREACRINQKPLEEFVGRVHWDEWPAAIGTDLECHLRRAMVERVEVHFEHHYVTGAYDVWLEVDVYPSEDGINLFYRDITGRKRAEEALRASERRFREMADAIPHIAWTTGPEGAVDYYNQRWYDYSGLTLEGTRGWGWEAVIHPDDVERAGAAWRAAVEAGTVSEAEYRLRRADGEYRLHLGRSVSVLEGGAIMRWVGTATDIEDRRRAEEALRRSQEDLRLAIDGAHLGTFYCDWPLDRIVWNDTCKEHFFLSPDAEVDFDLFYSLLHPVDREPTRRAIERAMAERVEYDVEYRTQAPDGRTCWVNAVGRFHYGPEGVPVRFDGITLDISARKAAEEEMRRRAERERFLADLAERAQGLADPDEVIADAVRSVGEFLSVSRCVFANIDIEADTCTIPPDYRADDSVASMAGVFPISDFGPFLVAEYGAGRTVAVDDVRLDPVRVPADYLAAYEAVACRAFVAAPVLHSARLVSVIAVHSTTPRRWEPEEVELLQTVVERMWLTVEVTRQERALVREAEALREAHQHTARTLERIGDAFFALDSEWRFTYINSQAEALWGRTRAEMLGRNVWDEFPEAVGSTFDRQLRRALSEGVTIAFEEFYLPLDTWLDVHVYPSPDGLSVFFQNVNARKALEIERERLTEREHTIATQLQEALQPPTPTSVPGLTLAEYYRPAWKDQGVGGDFSDVFSTDKGVTFLVVGDLSGKGLAAASQVATVRHMLRFALLNGRSVAGPVTALNETLAENELLTGFATLFVGRYEAGTGTFCYVNCGQDAGLILRAATGLIDTLPPTGPVLGAVGGAMYTEGTVTLEAGDVLALYTDGLTEVGPSRTALLTGDGVADLLSEQVGKTDPQGIVERLMAGVDAYAGSGVRDDQCLLVCLAMGPGAEWDYPGNA